ncbi:MAG: cytochrome c [Acidobacteriota bacterium]
MVAGFAGVRVQTSVVGAAVVALAIGAVSLLASAEPTKPAARDVAAGGKMFALACQSCHGKNGVGSDKAPSLGESKLPLAGIRRVIANGRKDTKMVGFSKAFSPEEIDQLAAYIVSIKGPSPSAHP